MPTPLQAEFMRVSVGAVVTILQSAGIRLPEAMTLTLERFRQLNDDEAAAYGLRLFDNGCWRSIPNTFDLRVNRLPVTAIKANLLHSLMTGLAPYQRERVAREERDRRS